jgi:hypothetical protein
VHDEIAAFALSNGLGALGDHFFLFEGFLLTADGGGLLEFEESLDFVPFEFSFFEGLAEVGILFHVFEELDEGSDLLLGAGH